MNSLMQAGWLGDLTNWLLGLAKKLWDAFAEFMGDLFLIWLKHALDMFVFVLQKLPVPDVLTGSNLQTLFGAAGGTIGWWISTFQIDKCMAAVSAAIVFYIIRRIFTLGIW
ncbi:phage coat protein [Xanthomonas campestris pv. raphani]|uniref:phage coat protein n=2 Tax=Xanthomonas campestris TaxID=339 RepID=UPI002B237113|nr:phage coat protein [Xanthomonas campestris]MEA9709181.1 phage coat protein [Xanthomonas campestris pv. raphani]